MILFLVLVSIWIILGVRAFMMDNDCKELNSEVIAEFILYIISAPLIFMIFMFMRLKEYMNKTK